MDPNSRYALFNLIAQLLSLFSVQWFVNSIANSSQGIFQNYILGMFLYVLTFYQTWSRSKIICITRVIRFLIQTTQTKSTSSDSPFQKFVSHSFQSQKFMNFICVESSLSLILYKIISILFWVMWSELLFTQFRLLEF